jgi:hypothetical protein
MAANRDHLQQRIQEPAGQVQLSQILADRVVEELRKQISALIQPRIDAMVLEAARAAAAKVTVNIKTAMFQERSGPELKMLVRFNDIDLPVADLLGGARPDEHGYTPV